MVFKRFRWVVFLFIGAFFLTLLLLVWLLLQTSYYATIVVILLLLIAQVYSFIKYIEKTNVEITRFLNGIHYDDFSATYPTNSRGKTFKELHRELNRVVSKFQEIRAEKEAQYHYLRSIVQHINIGLIAIDEYQKVQLINNAAKRLLGINHLDTLQMLQENFPELVASIEALHSEEKKVLKFQVNEEIAQITLSATSIKLLGKTYKLVSLQDIHTELEEKEMEAWQNLTRVLTHEIINSVTPITSLASTLAQELDEQVDDNGGYEFIESEEIKDAHKAIQVIEKRSAALVDFVTDFRNFTKIPSPKFQLFEIEELFKGIEILMKDDFKKVDITFHYEVQPAHLQLSADPALIEQILINLITNSMQALHNIAEARIVLSAQVDENSKVIMKVSDNGAGISEEARKHIFVPFFTTKRTGSGIGLSLSRQIMRMHGGSITVNSVPKQETTFTLKFA